MGKAELRIEIDAELLAQAKASGLDLVALAEESLRLALGKTGMAESGTPALSHPVVADEEKARRWAEQNADAIEAQRQRIEQFGVFGEDLRTW